MSRTPGFGDDQREAKAWEEITEVRAFEGEARKPAQLQQSCKLSRRIVLYLCTLQFYAAEAHRPWTQAALAARPQLLPSTHPSSNNAFIGDKSCCTTPAWPDAPVMSTVKETGQPQDSSCHVDFPVFLPCGAIKLLLSSQQMLKQHSFHFTNGTDQIWKTVWSFCISPSKPTPMHSTDHPPTQLPFSIVSVPPLCCIIQSSRMEWKTVWVSSLCTLQGANRRQLVRNSVFQSKQQLKTCYVKGFIRVLKIHVFKGSWPLRATAAQADLLPRSNMVPHTAAWPTTWTRGFKLSYMNWFTRGLRRVSNRAHTQLIHDWISILPANMVYGYHLIAINETNSSF